MPRCGLVTLAGKPNAGKSSLLNRLVDEPLAITSPKPQSTRQRVTGILDRGETQMVLIDTPGLIQPGYELQRAMRAASLRALSEADVVIHVIDAARESYESLATVAGLARPIAAPIVTVFNKMDLVRDDVRARHQASLPDALFVSATRGDGLDALLVRIGLLLPESPFLYDAADASTQPFRFFVCEFVREAALDQLDDELPYAVACVVEEFREDRNPVYIRAVLYVERASQKRILIGSGGSRIREIGRAARLRIEALADAPVYLDLWVKVLDNWRRDANALRRLGYDVPEDSKP